LPFHYRLHGPIPTNRNLYSRVLIVVTSQGRIQAIIFRVQRCRTYNYLPFNYKWFHRCPSGNKGLDAPLDRLVAWSILSRRRYVYNICPEERRECAILFALSFSLAAHVLCMALLPTCAKSVHQMVLTKAKWSSRSASLFLAHVSSSWAYHFIVSTSGMPRIRSSMISYMARSFGLRKGSTSLFTIPRMVSQCGDFIIIHHSSTSYQ
jgi:hypothetical protein